MAAVLPYVPMVAEGAINLAKRSSVAQRAFAYARRQLPGVAQQATQFFEKQNKDITVLAASKSPNNQAIVVGQLMKAGLPASTFIQDHELTAEEARTYAQLINKHVVAQRDAVDRDQTVAASTGDSYLDTVQKNNDIESICRMLGISSDQYAKLIRCLNSHTSGDVERFQLDRLMRKLRPL